MVFAGWVLRAVSIVLVRDRKQNLADVDIIIFFIFLREMASPNY
jgi:hypothetical protein